MNRLRPAAVLLLGLALGWLLLGGTAWAQEVADPIGDGVIAMADGVRDVPVATSVRLLVMLTALTFLPAVILAMTPFTRFVIVFALLRQAMGTQQSPPNQVLVGLSLFLSILLMQPTLEQVKTQALDPFMAGQTDAATFVHDGMVPMRAFMLANTRRADMATIMEIGHIAAPDSLDELPTSAVASAYVLSELKTAFIIGVKIYIPFLVIDIVVANVLLGMGMMVLPPVIISLPFKLMLFVLMDGWNLLVHSMAAGFGGL